MGVLLDLAGAGSQVICATHSPILAVTPGADIVELGKHGMHHTTWAELDLTGHCAHWLAAVAMPPRSPIKMLTVTGHGTATGDFHPGTISFMISRPQHAIGWAYSLLTVSIGPSPLRTPAGGACEPVREGRAGACGDEASSRAIVYEWSAQSCDH